MIRLLTLVDWVALAPQLFESVDVHLERKRGIENLLHPLLPVLLDCFLQDAIEGMGAVSRDAVCSNGSDVLFVDDSGVRSLGRSIQEQSQP